MDSVSDVSRHELINEPKKEPSLHEVQLDQTVNGEKEAQESVRNSGPSPYITGWRLAVTVVALCLGTLLVALDSTIIAVVIPQIS